MLVAQTKKLIAISSLPSYPRKHSSSKPNKTYPLTANQKQPEQIHKAGLRY